MTAFAGAGAARVEDREYLDLTLAAVEAAQRRVWGCVFIVDVRPPRDLEGRVLELVTALTERVHAGVDVRILLAGHVDTADIAVANLATGLLLREYGVPTRRVFDGQDDGRLGSHAKFLVADDEAVVGSQNWTDDAFRLNVEDAVFLTGPPVRLLAAEFARLWAVGRGLPRDERS